MWRCLRHARYRDAVSHRARCRQGNRWDYWTASAASSSTSSSGSTTAATPSSGGSRATTTRSRWAPSSSSASRRSPCSSTRAQVADAFRPGHVHAADAEPADPVHAQGLEVRLRVAVQGRGLLRQHPAVHGHEVGHPEPGDHARRRVRHGAAAGVRRIRRCGSPIRRRCCGSWRAPTRSSAPRRSRSICGRSSSAGWAPPWPRAGVPMLDLAPSRGRSATGSPARSARSWHGRNRRSPSSSSRTSRCRPRSRRRSTSAPRWAIVGEPGPVHQVPGRQRDRGRREQPRRRCRRGARRRLGHGARSANGRQSRWPRTAAVGSAGGRNGPAAAAVRRPRPVVPGGRRATRWADEPRRPRPAGHGRGANPGHPGVANRHGPVGSRRSDPGAGLGVGQRPAAVAPGSLIR